MISSERSTFIDVLQKWSSEDPDRTAFVFLADGEKEAASLTYRELDRRARSLGAFLDNLGLRGDRVLLLYPPGLDFIVSFFGCLYGGCIAIPAPGGEGANPKRTLPRLQAIANDADASLALTTPRMLSLTKAGGVLDVKGLRWQSLEDLSGDLSGEWRRPDVARDSLAFLQYTSGSTGTPRGVMVCHGNLLHQCAAFSQAAGYDADSTSVTWLPHFHDYGLIQGLLVPLFNGAPSYVMSPMAFLKRPVSWVQAISRYKATHSEGPNFAYNHCLRHVSPPQCAGLDLRSWYSAGVAAEPINPDILRRFVEAFEPYGFRRTSLCPGYGLAEVTLAVSTTHPAQEPVFCDVSIAALEEHRIDCMLQPGGAAGIRTLVGCGRILGEGIRVVIANPKTRTRCQPDEIGEIWVSGASIAQGYWRRPDESEETFHAYLADTGEGPFLRTGDLGGFQDLELFIAGRLKDLIIVGGVNHHPQDIEWSVERSHQSIRPHGCAAFSIEEDGEERLVVIAEIKGRCGLPDVVIRAIREAVAEHHDLSAGAIALVKSGGIPKTSSGKIQRRACRAAFVAHNLDCIAIEHRPSASIASQSVGDGLRRNSDAESLQDQIRSRLAARLGLNVDDIDLHTPFASYGLGSRDAVSFVGELEDWRGEAFPPTLLYEFPTVYALSVRLAGERGLVQPSSHSAGNASGAEPLAIIGMGCRFPGADDPEAFWQLLRNEVDAVRELPDRRSDLQRLAQDTPTSPGARLPGGYLDDVDQFNAEFFGISPQEARHIDPQQRLLLEVAWQALEHAGVAPHALAGSRTGVFIGISNADYAWFQFKDPAFVSAYAGTGTALSIAANRISYQFDLRGPSLAVDTACSSSLVAVHLACQSLRTGQSDLVLAGGVNLILTPIWTDVFSQAGMLAPDGRCKTFDAGANGFVRGEGCGVVVLKRLADAVADGDRVLAVIRGTAVNQDGLSNGLTAPNPAAQQDVVRGALAAAGVAPAAVQYVEAHGTGTALGDPIEVQALGAVLGEGRAATDPVVIGSVKSNIGHLEAAAGVAGLIKVVLALAHGEIPAQLHFRAPNPYIAWGTLPVAVAQTRQPWPAGAPLRLAGVSSFGFGGTNAHVVVEEGPRAPSAAVGNARPLSLLTLSAKSAAALHQLTERVHRHLATVDDEAPAFAEVCFTAYVGRAHFAHRLAVVAATASDARAQLEASLQGAAPAGVVRGEAPAAGSSRLARLPIPARDADRAAWGPVLAQWAEAYVCGAALDWPALEAGAVRRKVAFPTYPFQRHRYWIDGPAAVAAARPAHPLLGPRVRSASPDVVFETQLTASDPVLREHRVHDHVVLPGAAQLGMVFAAAAEVWGPGAYAVEAVTFREALVLAAEQPVTVQVIVRPEADGGARFELRRAAEGAGAGGWRVHATGRVRADAAAVGAADPGAPPGASHSVADFYAQLAAAGYALGPRFQWIAGLWHAETTAWAQMRPATGEETAWAGLHPGLLDSCFQVMAATLDGGAPWPVYMPLYVERMRYQGPGVGPLSCEATRTGAAGETVTADLRVRDARGALVAEITGLAVKRASRAALEQTVQRPWRDWLYQVAWRPQPRTAEEHAGVETLAAPRQVADHLTTALARSMNDGVFESWATLWHELDALSLDYVVRAFEQLGWRPQTGERVEATALAEQLGICADQRRLLQRLLKMLEEEGILERRDGWEVRRASSTSGAEQRHTALADRYPAYHAILSLLHVCGGQLADVLRGTKDPLQLLFPGGSLRSIEAVYQDSPLAQALNGLLRDAMVVALQSVPPDRKIRILEVGAGTGATTSYLLSKLTGHSIEYVFTDISPLFLARAKQKFRDHGALQYALLDIERDPAEQGFANRQFDVIVAANVLHATRDLHQTIRHVGQLIAPDGVLLVLEGTRPERWVDLTFGLTDGWWRFADRDLRPSGPLLREAQWLTLLGELGFRDAEAIPVELPQRVALGGQTIVMARGPRPASSARGTWVIYADGQGVAAQLADRMRSHGDRAVLLEAGARTERLEADRFQVDPLDRTGMRHVLEAVTGEGPAPWRGVVHLWSLDLPAAEGQTGAEVQAAQGVGCGSVLHLVHALGPHATAAWPPLWLITRGAQSVAGDAAPPAVLQAPLWGLGSVIALEHPEFQCRRIDLDPAGGAAPLWDEICHAGREDQVAFRGDTRLVARLTRY